MPTPEESVVHPVEVCDETLESNSVYVASRMSGDKQCPFARNSQCHIAIAGTRGKNLEYIDVVQIHSEASTDPSNIALEAAQKNQHVLGFTNHTKDRNGGFVGTMFDLPTCFVNTCRECRGQARQIVLNKEPQKSAE